MSYATYTRRKKKWKKPEALYVEYQPGVRRLAGILDENRNVFKKHVRESTHLFRKLDAWGIDAEIYNNILKPRNAEIVVHDDETGRMYMTRASRVAQYGRYFHFKDDKQSHKAQIFLSRAYWDRTPAREWGKPSAAILDPRTLLQGTLAAGEVDKARDEDLKHAAQLCKDFDAGKL